VSQLLKPIWFVALQWLFICFRADAQSDLNAVRVTPRGDLKQPDTIQSSIRTDMGVIRTTVELVLVPVTVMDESNRIVTGLEQENFQLYEDKHPQPIRHFWKEDAPVSVGIVLDVSGSMNTKIERARDAVGAMLKASNPQDEFFMITFADQPTLVQDFTPNVDDIQSHLLFTTPKGGTSLLDAIVLAVSNMRKAQYQRKALVIVSDGGDNRSRYTEKDVKSLIKEQDLLVYSIGVIDRECSSQEARLGPELPGELVIVGSGCRTQEERLGPQLLTEISSLTGASAYTLDNPNYLPAIAGRIATELRNQYILGYSPDGSRRDGRWRKIKVRLAVPHGLPPLHVQARTGYYSTAY
jgi:Ca-activated chloride channel family protein